MIRKTPDGFQFEAHDGHMIGSRLSDPVDPDSFNAFDPETALAEWGGERMDYDHLMFVLAHNQELLEARAAPP